jgi:replicative DNA helicase
VTNLAHHARTVREKSTARHLIQLLREVMARCYQGEERPAAVLKRAFRFVFGNIKSQDAIVVGRYPRFKDEVRENAELVRRICSEP